MSHDNDSVSTITENSQATPAGPPMVTKNGKKIPNYPIQDPTRLIEREKRVFGTFFEDCVLTAGRSPTQIPGFARHDLGQLFMSLLGTPLCGEIVEGFELSIRKDINGSQPQVSHTPSIDTHNPPELMHVYPSMVSV